MAAAPQITEQGYRLTFRHFPTSVDLIRNGLSLYRDLFQATGTAPRTAVLISPGSPGMYEEPFYKALGKYSEYAITNVPWYSPKAELTRRVEGAFKKRFPQDGLMFHAVNVGFTFEAMMVVADAFKRSGSTDGATLADAMRQTNIANRMMLGGPIPRAASPGDQPRVGAVSLIRAGHTEGGQG